MLETAQVFINRKMDKFQYSHTMEYYSAIRSNELLKHLTMWIYFQTMVSEEASRKSACCVALFTYRSRREKFDSW